MKTAKARHRIKQALHDQKKKLAVVGREQLQVALRKWGARVEANNINALIEHFGSRSAMDLYYQVARGKHVLEKIEGVQVKNSRLIVPKVKRKSDERPLEEVVAEIRGVTPGALLIGDDLQKIDYQLSTCCNPIAGDDVFGFITVGEGIKIHRVNCPNAVQLMSNFAYRIVAARFGPSTFPDGYSAQEKPPFRTMGRHCSGGWDATIPVHGKPVTADRWDVEAAV